MARAHVWAGCGPVARLVLGLALAAALACDTADEAKSPAHSLVVGDHTDHADSVVFGGRQHATADSIRRLARVNPDLYLLERLLDEYAGLDFLVEGLGQREGVTVQGPAWRRSRSEHRRIAELRQAMADAFHERYQAEPREEHRRAADSIAALEGKDAQRRALDEALLESHTRKLLLIEALYPRLRRAQVRVAIDRIRAELQDDVRDLTKRLEN